MIVVRAVLYLGKRGHWSDFKKKEVVYEERGDKMKTFKKSALRVFFILEVTVFAGVYLFGPNGLQTMVLLEQENGDQDNEIVRLLAEVVSCEHKIAEYKADDFFKEKIAREQLQMARDGDEVYLIE